jgi:beta-galactosidase
MAAVRITVRDEFGNVAPYAQLPIRLKLEGTAELIGPDVIVAEGGMTGTYIRTVGETGPARLTVRCEGLESVSLDFHVV